MYKLRLKIDRMKHFNEMCGITLFKYGIAR